MAVQHSLLVVRLKNKLCGKTEFSIDGAEMTPSELLSKSPVKIYGAPFGDIRDNGSISDLTN